MEVNCIELLQQQLQECAPCIWNGKIIEFDDLPESEKERFHYYDKDLDYLFYCKKCEVYKLLPTI